MACIGSGPSLTREDCRLLAGASDFVIAVNSSWQLVPEADAVYAGDDGWWRDNHHLVPGYMRKLTCMFVAAERYGLQHHRIGPGAYNSGMRAIQWALEAGAKRIVLLGYDCSVVHGRHWHEDHPGGDAHNPSDSRCAAWQQQFASIHAKGAEIINCSRYTELTAFPVMRLEDELAIC